MIHTKIDPYTLVSLEMKFIALLKTKTKQIIVL